MTSVVTDESKIILEKKIEIAQPKEVGGNQLSKVNGVHVKIEKLNICVCGQQLEENKIIICQVNGEKLCESCAIDDTKQKICIHCLRKKFDLSKQQYKILKCIENGTHNNFKINRLTKIPNQEIEKTKEILRNSDYIIRKFFGFESSDKGIELIGLYSQVYDSEKDISDFLEGLDSVVF